MSEAVRVNFAHPLPVFPLPDAVLLPHAIQPLHIFEACYKQMIDDCLDGDRQVAMASFAEQLHDDDDDCACASPLRPVVCVGKIVQHAHVPGDRHDILLQGVCRAKIIELIEPENGRLYRMAKLSPLEPVDELPPPMPEIRRELRKLLNSRTLSRLRCIETVMHWFDRDDVPTHALMELIGFALLRDGEVRYQLLAEASPQRRADMIKGELLNLSTLVSRAERQSFDAWPKGLSWN